MRKLCCAAIFAVSFLLLSNLVLAQGAPRLTGVDPGTGKVGASITVSGENLGKANVAAVFLSDANSDYKATVVDQAADKIVIKVPAVKPGNYNISLQVKNEIFIQPIRFTVEE